MSSVSNMHVRFKAGNQLEGFVNELGHNVVNGGIQMVLLIRRLSKMQKVGPNKAPHNK